MKRFLFLIILFAISPCIANPNEHFELSLSNKILWKDNVSYYAAYLPDGNSVIIDGWLWDCETEQLIRRLNEFSPGRKRFAVSSNGKTFALIDEGYSGHGNTIHWYGVTLVDVKTGNIIHTFEIPDSSITGGKVSFNNDGSLIFVISYDKLFLLSVNERKIVQTFPLRGWRTCAISPTGQILAEAVSHNSQKNYLKSNKLDIQIQLSSLGSEKTPIALFTVEEEAISNLGFTSDEKYIYANENNGKTSCLFWNIQTKEKIEIQTTFDEISYNVFSGNIFQDRYLIMIDDKFEQNSVLDLKSGKIIPILSNNSGRLLVIGIAPNGKDCVVQRYVPSESPQLNLFLGHLTKQGTK